MLGANQLRPTAEFPSANDSERGKKGASAEAWQ